MPPKKKPARELSKRQLYRRADYYRQKLQDHEFSKTDGLVAAGIVGGALATALAIRAARNHGNKLVDAEGKEVSVFDSPTQYMRNTTSIVEPSGRSASFPEGEDQVERLRNPHVAAEDPSIFVQEPGGRTTHILREGLQDGPIYRWAIDYGADLGRRALDLVRSRPQDPSDKE